MRHNAVRRSIAGLSFDLVLWTAIASLGKALHIALLRWNPLAIAQYAARFPLTPVPVRLAVENGLPVVGSPGASGLELLLYVHTLVLCSALAFQIRTHRATTTLAQDISTLSLILLGLVAVLGMTCLGYIYTGKAHTKWLDFVYCFYAVGEVAEWFRYMPQVSVNFMCRSTAGLSPRFLAVEAADTMVLVLMFACNGTAQPNSLLFMTFFKTLLVGYLVYQHLRVYKNQCIRCKLRYKPVPSSDIELSNL